MGIEEKRKELMRLSNVANTRMMAQEKNHTQNTSYYEALNDIYELGGTGTRFSRSKKLSETQIDKQLEAVQKYLSNPSTTQKGYKLANALNNITVYDNDTMKSMSRQQLEQEYLQQAKLAQSRMYRIEKKGMGDDKRAIGKAKQFLEDYGLTTFTTGKKNISNMSDKDLRLFLQNASKYNNSKTSTLSGIKEQNKLSGLVLRLKGFDIPEEKQQDFFNFLSSKEGKALKKQFASTQFLEQMSLALQGNYSVDDIKENAIQYLTDNESTPDLFFQMFSTHTIFK